MSQRHTCRHLYARARYVSTGITRVRVYPYGSMTYGLEREDALSYPDAVTSDDEAERPRPLNPVGVNIYRILDENKQASREPSNANRLARKMGKPNGSYIYDIAHRKTVPELPTVLDLSWALNVRADELTRGMNQRYDSALVAESDVPKRAIVSQPATEIERPSTPASGGMHDAGSRSQTRVLRLTSVDIEEVHAAVESAVDTAIRRAIDRAGSRTPRKHLTKKPRPSGGTRR